MQLDDVTARFEEAIKHVSLDILPSLAGMISRWQTTVQIRLMTGQPGNQTPHADDVLTIPEVAKRLKISRYRAYELARQGALKSVRLGKSVRVKPSDLSEYLGRQGA